MSANQQLAIPKTSFKFYKIMRPDPHKVFDAFNANDNRFSLKEGKCGFHDARMIDDCVEVLFTEFVGHDVEALEEGVMVTKQFVAPETAYYALFSDFAIVCGRPTPLKVGEWMLAQTANIELRPLILGPSRVNALSDHMTQMTAIDFYKMPHHIYKSVKLAGTIESLADIAPFHTFQENVKSIKGLVNTPEGVRTIKIDISGGVGIKKKKEEELTVDFYKWLYNFVTKAGENV